MTVTLDSGSKSAAAVLSNGDLTVGATNFASNGARGNLLIPTGKVWFEINRPSSSGSGAGVGLCISATPNYSTLAGEGGAFNGIIMFYSGNVWMNGVFILNVEHGAYVMFGVDFTNHRLYIRSSSASFGWNSVGADPDAGTLGMNISSIDGAGLYPVGLIPHTSDTINFNFGATPPVNTPPGTFTSWDGGVVPPASRHLLVNSRMAPFRQVASATAMYTSILSNLASTEHRDTASFDLYPSDGAIVGATEARDTFGVTPPARYNVGVLNAPHALVDDDVIYVLEDNETMYVPADFSDTLVIPEEEIMYAT